MSAHDTGAGRRLSIIVVVYNMRREAPRTLYSLSAEYQGRGLTPDDYEVVVVENGSSEPLSPDEVASFGRNFRYLRIDDASPSPAAAINFAVSQVQATDVGIMIDGARMASPGVVGLALRTLASHERPIIGTVSFHLGPDIQPRSITRGYDQAVEDRLLAGIDWQHRGQALFEISTLAGSSRGGRIGGIAERINPQSRTTCTNWRRTLAESLRSLHGIVESNLTFLPKALFEELDGFDVRFDLPGGGLVSADFYRRASELHGTTWITLTGVATFHQVHGGTMTNRPRHEGVKELAAYLDQFERIHGVPFKPSSRGTRVIGWAEPEDPRASTGADDLRCYADPESRRLRSLMAAARMVTRLERWLTSLRSGTK